MKILILSFYFPPDLSAGSFRCASLVDALENELNVAKKQGEILIFSSSPNRYGKYMAPAEAVEVSGMRKVVRVSVPRHSNSMLGQIRTFFSYATIVWRETRNYNPDVVLGTSSRLMTAVLAAIVARRERALLYLDIRDIFSETVRDVFIGWKGRVLECLFRSIEKRIFARAARLNVVSEGFLPYVQQFAAPSTLRVFTNGIDELFMGNAAEQVPGRVSSVRTMVYAGNIGEGQGLERVIPQAAKRLGSGWRILVVGAGGTEAKLRGSINSQGLNNVEIRPPVKRQELLQIYTSSDVLFLHLNAKNAFKRVLPSKIFEYAATGKPMLAGVDGYAADFIKKNVSNARVFAPTDVDDFMEKLQELKLEYTDRSSFVGQFAREKIMKLMARDVLELAAGAGEGRS